MSRYAETVLLYLSGLSRNAIALLKSVVPSTVLRGVRQFAEQWATKPQPGPGGVVVMERDELWHFVGNKENKPWIWLAFCRDTGQRVDWECGDRDQATLAMLLKRLRTWKVGLYCTDGYVCYDQTLPAGEHYQGKEETWRVEQINSRLRHWLARFRRRTVVVSKAVEMVNLTIALFARFCQIPDQWLVERTHVTGSLKTLFLVLAMRHLRRRWRNK